MKKQEVFIYRTNDLCLTDLKAKTYLEGLIKQGYRIISAVLVSSLASSAGKGLVVVVEK